MNWIKKDYFVTKMFGRLLLPSVISSCGYAMSDMVDALVIGRKMGATGLAAISLCLPIYMLMNIIMDSFALGGGIHFSTLFGERQEEEARNCFNRIVRTTLGIGIIFAVLSNVFLSYILTFLGAGEKGSVLYGTCFAYARILTAGSPVIMLNIVLNNFLRNDNREEIAARGFLVGNLTDIVLNIIFVLVFDFGAGGAALSTVIGSAVAVGLYLPAIFSKQGFLQPKLAPFCPLDTARCFFVGFSVSVQNIFTFLFLLVVNRIMLGLGGEQAVAVFDVVYNASFFIIYLCEGTSEAAQPLVSMFLGEKSEEDCKTVLHLSQKAALILSFIAATTIFLFAKYVAILFGIEEELMVLSVRALRIYCLGFAFLAMNIIFIRYYQAKEENTLAFLGVFLRNFAVLLPSAIVMSLSGISCVWFLFPFSEAITFVLFCLPLIFRKKENLLFDEDKILRIHVTEDPTTVAEMLEQCDTFCEKREATPAQQYCVRLILEEIVTSIIRNALTNTKDGRIRITLLAMPNGDFILHILDNAVVFDIFSFHPKKEKSPTDFDIDEISMKLIKKNVKTYIYRQSHGFNSLTVRM